MISLIEPETEEEDGVAEAIGDDQPDYEGEPADADEGILLSQSLVIQSLMLALRQDEHTKRNNVFRTHRNQPTSMWCHHQSWLWRKRRLRSNG
jgi:hypothetical protein